MNVGLLSLYWDRPQKTGIEVYAAEIFRRLRPNDGEKFYYLGAPEAARDLGVPVSLSNSNRLVQLAWDIPRAIHRHHIDVFFNPSQYTYWGSRQHSVVSAFDVAWRYFPDYFPHSKRVAFELLTRHMVAHASKILAISEATRQDMITLFGCPEDKIVTVPLGVDRTHLNEVKTTQDAAVLRHYDLEGRRYVLFLGTLQRRKNVETLIQAFNALVDDDLTLVLAGGRGWFHEKISEAIEASPKRARIIVTGFLPEDHKPALYRSCAVFAYPSLYEGFGIPVLEAMSCGCICITSNVSSLPEVIGDAGIAIDPFNVEELREELAATLSGKHEGLRVQALERAKSMTWDRVADHVGQLIRDVGANR